MKNEIQKLIKWAEVRQKANSAMNKVCTTDKVKWQTNGRLHELAFFIEQLKLLLKDESKQPQPPDFANTMLGEVPHEVNAQSEDTTQAVEGATPVVRQNEQTVKPCRCCGAEIKNDVGDGLCAECWSKLLTY